MSTRLSEALKGFKAPEGVAPAKPVPFEETDILPQMLVTEQKIYR